MSMTIAEYCKKARLKSGMKRSVFASILGVTPNSTDGYEAGEVTPTVKTLIRMQEISGVRLDEVDPRILRGRDLLPWLPEAIHSGGWDYKRIQAATGLGVETVRSYVKTVKAGGTIPKIKPHVAIAICDLCEGRALPFRQDGVEDSVEDAAPAGVDAPAADAAPAEDAPTIASLDEKRAETVMRTIFSPVENYGFRRAGGRKYVASTDKLLDAVVEVMDGRKSVLRVYFRPTGRLSMEREFCV